LAHGKRKSPTRLDLIKAALRVFVFAKQKMNPNHEFALCVLTDVACWVLLKFWHALTSIQHLDLTTDTELFIKKVNSLQSAGDFQVLSIRSCLIVVFFLNRKRIEHSV
jgi:hypothetical protein